MRPGTSPGLRTGHVVRPPRDHRPAGIAGTDAVYSAEPHALTGGISSGAHALTYIAAVIACRPDSLPALQPGTLSDASKVAHALTAGP